VARFSEEDRKTIWDMREAGVPVKRIARHLGRQNSSLRKFIADAGGRRPTARERCALRLSLTEREEISRVWPRDCRSEQSLMGWADRRRRSVGR
jgi:transposase-like protein